MRTGSVSTSSRRLVEGTLSVIRGGLDGPRCSVRSLDESVYVDHTALCHGVASVAKDSPSSFIGGMHLHGTIRLLGRKKLSVTRVTSRINFGAPDCFAGSFGGLFKMLPARCGG